MGVSFHKGTIAVWLISVISELELGIASTFAFTLWLTTCPDHFGGQVEIFLPDV